MAALAAFLRARARLRRSLCRCRLTFCLLLLRAMELLRIEWVERLVERRATRDSIPEGPVRKSHAPRTRSNAWVCSGELEEIATRVASAACEAERLVAAKRIRRIRRLLVDDFGEYGSHRGGLVVVKRLDCGKARH